MAGLAIFVVLPGSAGPAGASTRSAAVRSAVVRSAVVRSEVPQRLAAPRAPRVEDLPRLTAELAAVTAHAQTIADQLDAAAARDGGLRVSLERLAAQQVGAQHRLDVRARQVYMGMRPDPLGDWQRGIAQPDLRELERRGQQATLTVDRSLVQAVTEQSTELLDLRRRATVFRARMLSQASQVFADQDRAHALLATAMQLTAAQAAGVQAGAQVTGAQLTATLQAQLRTQQATLDAVSATVTLALTPAQSRRTRAAATSQAAVVALLEATGSGIPAGYARSGQRQSGTASWYGPGFAGRPTASGAPYDPERLTCANKAVPLGTVLHVSSGGRETNCLVNDRGPYVGDRILDMSRAGSRNLGYDGLAHVVIEVLVPV